MLNDLDHLGIVVAGHLHRADILIADMAAGGSDLAAKRTAAAALGSFEVPVRLGRDLGIVELGDVPAEIGMAERQ